MKKIILIFLVFLLNLTIVYAADLSDYPDFFVKDNKFDGIFIVGDSAPADDIIAVSDIIGSFSQMKISTGYIKISSEVPYIYKQNVVVVGNACTNKAASILLDNPSSCFPGLESNQGIIRMSNKEGYYQLLVGGALPLGTRNAAEVLKNYKEFNLKGKKILVEKYSDGQFNIKYSLDLSDFPGIFVKDSNLNVVIVVGDKASSSDVIEQSNLILFFGEYLNKQIKGAAKLSSDMQNLNQNIISIGNPCVNPVTAQIMNNPQPCDKDFQAGKAYINLSEYNGYYHLIVAGNSDAGTKKAVEVLINYGDYNLEGNQYSISLEAEDDELEDMELEIDIENETIEDEVEVENITAEIEAQDMEDLGDEIGEIEERELNITNNKLNMIKNNSNLERDEGKSKEKTENINIFKKIINWIKSLFG